MEKTCEKCGATSVPHSVTHVIRRLPPVLAVHIKRFRHEALPLPSPGVGAGGGAQVHSKFSKLRHLVNLESGMLDVAAHCLPAADRRLPPRAARPPLGGGGKNNVDSKPPGSSPWGSGSPSPEWGSGTPSCRSKRARDDVGGGKGGFRDDGTGSPTVEGGRRGTALVLMTLPGGDSRGFQKGDEEGLMGRTAGGRAMVADRLDSGVFPVDDIAQVAAAAAVFREAALLPNLSHRPLLSPPSGIGGGRSGDGLGGGDDSSSKGWGTGCTTACEAGGSGPSGDGGQDYDSVSLVRRRAVLSGLEVPDGYRGGLLGGGYSQQPITRYERMRTQSQQQIQQHQSEPHKQRQQSGSPAGPLRPSPTGASYGPAVRVDEQEGWGDREGGRGELLMSAAAGDRARKPPGVDARDGQQKTALQRLAVGRPSTAASLQPQASLAGAGAGAGGTAGGRPVPSPPPPPPSGAAPLQRPQLTLKPHPLALGSGAFFGAGAVDPMHRSPMAPSPYEPFVKLSARHSAAASERSRVQKPAHDFAIPRRAWLVRLKNVTP